MYIIRDTKYILIPLAYNEFCNDIKSLRDSSKYVGPIQRKRIIDKNIITDIIDICNKNLNIPIVIDMNNIINYSNRDFNRLMNVSINLQIVVVNNNTQII